MTQSSSIHRIGIYIPNQCSLLELGSVSEPFARANQILGEEKYQITYIADIEKDSISITNASLPISLTAQKGITDNLEFDLLIIIAEQVPGTPISPIIQKSLQDYHAKPNSHILSVQAGWCWALGSEIGSEEQWAVHWRWEDDIQAKYPTLSARYDGYCSNDRISSASGHKSTMEAILNYLSANENEITVRTVADELYMERSQNSQQQIDTDTQTELQPRLQKAIALMESNLEEPLSADMIADLVHVSRRQLERLFKRYLDTMPARYYLQLRLKKAQQLLQTTNHSVVQIGLMCGFSSGPHFSSAYKSFFEITPREERAKRFYATR